MNQTVLPQQHIGEIITLHGSIYKIRRMSGFAFVLLRTSRDLYSCVYSPEKARFPLESLREECCVQILAQVISEERSRVGWELHLIEAEVLSEPAEPMPFAINGRQIDASLSTLLDYRPLTLRNDKQRAVFKLQEGVCRGFREFLYQEQFTEIHTPKIVCSGAEGGANIFHLDYFGQEAYLAQSPQFYKQMMTGVFERVFEIGPVFRAERHDTSRHLNEYTGVDFEMGYIRDFTEIMDMETQMIRHCLDFLRSEYQQELALLSVRLPDVQNIPAIPFAQAKQRIAGAYGRRITDELDFEPEEERLLCELIRRESGSEFVFVTRYPSAKRPFYAMDDPNRPQETLSFDLLFRGLEVTTGGQRIHSYPEQLDKMRRRGMDPRLFDSYLMIHRHGMPPHGGLGLGLERFVSRLLELDNIRQAALFPRDLHRLIP